MKGMVKTMILVSVLILLISPIFATGVPEKGRAIPDVVTITFAEHTAQPYDYFLGVVDAFEKKYPGVKIDIQANDTNTHKQKIMMAAQSGNLPDMFWIDEDLMDSLVAEGLLLDLKDHFIKAGINTYVAPEMLAQAAVNGGWYGIPSEQLITGYWINKQIFDRYGAQLPETFDDLLSAVGIFKANNMITISNGARSDFSEWTFEAMIGRYGFWDKWDRIMSGEMSYVNSDFIRFYERINQLAKAGAFSPSVATLDYSQAMEVFKGGNAAMVDSGAWLAGELEELNFSRDVVFWFGPTFPDGVGDQKIATMVGGGPYVVSAAVAEDPEKLQAIINFYAFLYGPEGSKIIADEYNALPVGEYEGTPDRENYPAFSALLATVNDAEWKSMKNQPSNVMSSLVQTAFYDSVYGVINQVYTPMQAVQLVQRAIEEDR